MKEIGGTRQSISGISRNFRVSLINEYQSIKSHSNLLDFK
jgi:hypothetical protein